MQACGGGGGQCSIQHTSPWAGPSRGLVKETPFQSGDHEPSVLQVDTVSLADEPGERNTICIAVGNRVLAGVIALVSAIWRRGGGAFFNIHEGSGAMCHLRSTSTVSDALSFGELVTVLSVGQGSGDFFLVWQCV